MSISWRYGNDIDADLITKKGYFFVSFSYHVLMRFLLVFDMFLTYITHKMPAWCHD